MTRALYIFIFFFVTYFNAFSQKSVNDYKYIIVPTQYEFLSEQDQYQLNSLTKFLFNKYGYTAFMNNEDFPQDLRLNNCLALTADVVKESGFLKTKVRIDLKDCLGSIVHSSQIGESREKDFAKTYNLALREAFETFQNMDYNYQPNEAILAKSTPQTSIVNSVKEQEEIARLKEEIKTLKDEKVESTEVKRPVIEPEEVSPTKEKIETNVETKELKSDVLYAQSLDNGFQIVDSTPKVVMILYPTGAKDVFTVKDKNAIVFKKENQWIYSENDGEVVKETVLNIKF